MNFVSSFKNSILIKIAFHNAYIHPLKEGHRFPMAKYELIYQQLLYEGLFSFADFFEPGLAAKKSIYLAHDPHYVDQLLDLSLDPKMVRRIGFPLSKELVNRELYLSQGSIEGAVYAQKYGIAFNIAGGTHHAGYDFGEGFCLLNDQAIAAAYLLNHRLAKRILIIDLDVHQGNGTAHIFRGNDQVYTFSMHGDKNFPFIKQPSDLDIPLADDLGDVTYLNLLEENLKIAFEQAKPDFVFYQAGVDVLETDKLGKLKLSMEACKERDYQVIQYCHKLGIPVQVSMGGGYSAEIKTIVNAHVNTYRVALDLYTH